MANQANYTELTQEGNLRYSLSRVANIPTDELLFSVEPADFGFTVKDNIEIHFYSKLTENLIYSQKISLEDGILGIRTIQYEDSKFRNYVTFDFNKYIELYPLKISSGDYEIVLNIFSDEIGSYDDRKLIINAVSDSRTEINLRFNEVNEVNTLELNEFVKPAISKPYLDGVIQNIFQNAGNTSAETIGLTISKILSEIGESGEQEDLQRVDNIGKIQLLQGIISNLLDTVYARIRTELVSYPKYRVSESEIKIIIERIFMEEFNKIKDTLRSDIILT